MKRRSYVLLGLVLLAGCGYNRIQQLDEAATAEQKQISVQLERRSALIPNLVATVRGYAQHEEDVFTKVTEARAAVTSALAKGDAKGMVDADNQLTTAVGRLMVVAEAYPTLKADQNFLKLQDDLSGTENRIAVARADYVKAVQSYNTYIRQFPQNLTAKVTGAKARESFELSSPAAAAVPVVDFKRPPPLP